MSVVYKNLSLSRAFGGTGLRFGRFSPMVHGYTVLVPLTTNSFTLEIEYRAYVLNVYGNVIAELVEFAEFFD